MTILTFTLAIFGTSILAGLLGALTGLGGGVVVVPVLALLFHVDLRYAIGASLVSVIATSSGAAAAYLREGYSNIRIGMFLEIATTFGALTGAWLAGIINPAVLGVIFGVVLLVSAYLAGQPHPEPVADGPPDPIAARLRLDGHMPTPEGWVPYHVRRIP